MDEAFTGNYSKRDLARLETLRHKAFQVIAPLQITFSPSAEPVPYSQKDSLVYRPIQPGHVWARKLHYCAWFHFTGMIPPQYLGRHLLLHIDVGGEGLVYTDSAEPYEMISTKVSGIDLLSLEQGKTMVELGDEIMRDGMIDFYMDAGFNGGDVMDIFGAGRLHYADLIVLDDAIQAVYYDYLTVLSLRAALGSEDLPKLETALDRAYTEILADRFQEARQALAPYLNGKPLDFTLYAVGHSHLDLAWLWPIRETKRKAARTFTKQLNIISRYPGYIYGASQPWQFAYLKENQPALYDRIRRGVADGSIEPQGGMWVEADTNISGGEALIRQLYYGSTFFREEFGKTMEICWLPDVFGYNGNLPQLLAKSGIPYFFTIKLSWNEHNKFPHRSFNWTGIDGSTVLVHMAPDETYNSNASPVTTRHAYENYPEKDVSGEALYVYGIGDGGGGPSESFLELLNRQKQLYKTPTVKFTTAIDYFKKLETYRDRLPGYTGELYLEKHQGTYTTQGRNKRFNRLCEYALCDVETLSAMAWLKGLPYDQDTIDAWWKEVLLYQFHDIIPGSSIGRVYDESRARYSQILSEINEKKEALLQFLSGQGDTLFAFNPTSFRCSRIADGYLAQAEPYSASAVQALPEGSCLEITEDTISNGLLRAVFSASGEIISLQCADGFEYCGQYLNRLKIFYDKKLYFNAWDIDWKYHTRPGTVLKAYKHELRREPGRVTRVNYYRHGLSVIRQEVTLAEGEDFLTVRTFADYHERHRMLRAEFTPAIFADRVACDIQYGTIYRSTRDVTPEEEAQFEICAHKYVDVSDENRGFSLLNDCKYGHRVKDGLISLNLLRSPVFPDLKADRGEHEFTYAIYPHSGPLSVDTLKRGYALNKPMVLFRGSAPIAPIAKVDNENIVIEVVKKACHDDALILRLYESQGICGSTALQLLFDHGKVVQTDLMEENEQPADPAELSFTPFEIKTIKVYLQN